MLSKITKPLNIGIVGGSLGGLFAGIALHRAGHNVNIYEKTGEMLNDRGAGIVLQHELIDFFNKYQIGKIDDIAVPIFERRYIDKNGHDTHLDRTNQVMTSWGAIYHRLIDQFPDNQYHYNAKFQSFTQESEKVIVKFEEGGSQEFDLLIGADGTNSSVRKILFPTISHTYSGYVGWRGIVQENELAPEVLNEFVDRFTFHTMPNSHILCYLIPGDDDSISPGHRRLNWVWYWNVPEGEEINELLVDINGRLRTGFIPAGYVQSKFIDKQRKISNQVMPPIFKALVESTKDLFIQPIQDLAVDKMYSNRVVLIGDAAFTPRPHTAASTAKAVANSVALIDSLRDNSDDVKSALIYWEQAQLSLGHYLKKKGIALGTQSQFGFNS